MKKFFVFLIAFLISSVAYATDIPMNVAVLRGLDKVTGRTSTFTIPVGEVGQFGKISIALESCYTIPPEESPENAAFLFIYEKSLKGENIELFKGWMFSSNPALSSMEHPVYDVWVLECKNNQEDSKELKEKVIQNSTEEKSPVSLNTEADL